MKKISAIRPWIIIAIAISMLIAILIMGDLSFRATKKATFDEFNQRQLVLAREAAGGIELYFETMAGDMRALGWMPGVQYLDEAETRREIMHTFRRLELLGANDVAILDAAGVVRYNVTAPHLEGVDFSWRRYFQEASEMTSDDTYIIEFIEFKGVDVGQKGVVVAVPIFETSADEDHPAPSGQFAGVAVCTLKLDTITQRFVTHIQSSERGQVTLVDDDANILWSPDNSLFGKNILKESEGFAPLHQTAESMTAGNSGTSEYSYYAFDESMGAYDKSKKEKKLLAFTPIRLGNETWTIAVWAPQDDAEKLIRSAYLRQLIVVGVGILIILSGSLYALALSFRTTRYLEKEVAVKAEELKQSYERYRKLVELSPDAIAIQSGDEIVFMNQAGAKLFGAEKTEQLIGKSVWDFVLPEYRETVVERYRQMWGQEGPASPIEQRFRRLDGTYVDVQVTAIPSTYQDKPAIQAIFHDITKFKQAEAELRTAHAFQQTILDGVTTPIMVIGAEREIKLMNQAARELWDKDTHRPGPLMCHHVSHQRETPCDGMEHPCPLEQARKLGRSVTVVHEHYLADEERRLVEVTATPIWGADGAFQGIIESTRDITEQQWAEDALEHQVQSLARSNEDLEQFAYKIVKSLQDFFEKLPPDEEN